LEIEGDGYRVFLYLDNGRIAGASANGLNVEELTSSLPDSLQNLAPILALTVGGKSSNELDGILELLNRKVVDPRLLRQLLRHQAALLIWRCFNAELKVFRFTQDAPLPSLVGQLRLESSVVALLIEGALRCNEAELPAGESDRVYVRGAPRGQNLDRAGVAAKHLKLLNVLTERRSANQLAEKLGWSCDEARRVLHAFVFGRTTDQERCASDHRFRYRSCNGGAITREVGRGRAAILRQSREGPIRNESGDEASRTGGDRLRDQQRRGVRITL
jgi:hypothetical protein